MDKNFYFTAVDDLGLPIHARGLTYDDACALFIAHRDRDTVQFCIFGEAGSDPTNLYCRGAEFK